MILRDGLYRVTTSYLCAGFVVEQGRVTRCADILRRKLDYWMTIAERVSVPERVAVVGNRRGADMQQVLEFIEALHASQPDSILVSGGAQGVDSFAESIWYRLGGKVRSYRPAPWGSVFGIEIWNYGGSQQAHVLGVEHQRVSFADYRSAAIYRDWMIAEDADKLVGFYRDRMAKLNSGAAITASLARDKGVQVYDFVREAE